MEEIPLPDEQIDYHISPIMEAFVYRAIISKASELGGPDLVKELHDRYDYSDDIIPDLTAMLRRLQYLYLEPGIIKDIQKIADSLMEKEGITSKEPNTLMVSIINIEMMPQNELPL